VKGVHSTQCTSTCPGTSTKYTCMHTQSIHRNAGTHIKVQGQIQIQSHTQVLQRQVQVHTVLSIVQ